MTFFLGIDGGGTMTRCALGDETRVLASATAGGSNVIRLGFAEAKSAIQNAVRETCEHAKISPDRIRYVCIGAAGGDRAEVAGKLRSMVAELTSAQVEVLGDTVIALEAAVGSGPGVIVIAGTGSIVFGRDAAGRTARAGGWGFEVSDEGSGHWIGHRAVAAILRAHDEGAKTLLTERILQAWNLESAPQLVETANSRHPSVFPRLFPVVLRAAAEGDALAKSLLVEAGTALAGLVGIVIQRLFPQPPYAPVATTGSVFRQSEEVRKVFYNSLHSASPGIEVRESLVEPVEGALARARKMGAAG
jgi:N-acetylglucosamine kinase-like BadF-type ATPase